MFFKVCIQNILSWPIAHSKGTKYYDDFGNSFIILDYGVIRCKKNFLIFSGLLNSSPFYFSLEKLFLFKKSVLPLSFSYRFKQCFLKALNYHESLDDFLQRVVTLHACYISCNKQQSYSSYKLSSFLFISIFRHPQNHFNRLSSQPFFCWF